MSLSDYPKMTEKDALLMNMLQLAYVGDAVWELMIRHELIRQGKNVHHMHSDCIRYVNAHAQASFAEALQETLSEGERDVIRRGRNAHARHPAPKNQNPEDYSAATGFEALIGFLYLTGQEERLKEIMKTILGGQKQDG